MPGDNTTFFVVLIADVPAIEEVVLILW